MAVVPDPRSTHPIPITAGIVPFTPRSLDVDRLAREALSDIDIEVARLQSERMDLDRRRDEGEEGLDYADELDTIETSMTAMPARRDAVVAGMAKLREMVKVKPIFMIKIPTPIERDRVQGRMRSLGLSRIDEQQKRSEMIMALYDLAWPGPDGQPLAVNSQENDAAADELASFCDDVWQRLNIYYELLGQWQAQEIEKQMDRRAGALRLPKSEPPPQMITAKERAKLNLLVNDVYGRSQAMKNLAALEADYESENQIVLVRMNVVDTIGLNLTVPVKVAPYEDAISREDAVAIREALCEQYGDRLGDAAWQELISYIDRSYSLDGFEEKNSDSPLAKPSDQNGLNGASGDTSTSGGNSTASPSGQAPDGGSEKITVKPSGSTGGSATPKDPTEQEPGPTGEG